jgi:5-methylcytosine-specific restriction protein A
MNRKQFIESLGLRYWRFAWSFAMPETQTVYFPIWDEHETDGVGLILSEDWRLNRANRPNAGYGRARRHIRRIEEEGWSMQTFIQHKRGEDPVTGTWQLGPVEPTLETRRLVRDGIEWYAVSESGEAPPIAEELSQDETDDLSEGAKTQVTVNAYERNPVARLKCLEHHGRTCAVCGFNFEEIFGEVARGYIHVHHINPVAAKKGVVYVVDPINDLIPVCPNCHVMLHKAGSPKTVQALRDLREKVRVAKAAG